MSSIRQLGPPVTAQTTAAIGLLLLHLSVGLTVIPVVAARLAPG